MHTLRPGYHGNGGHIGFFLKTDNPGWEINGIVLEPYKTIFSFLLSIKHIRVYNKTIFDKIKFVFLFLQVIFIAGCENIATPDSRNAS